MQTRQQDWRLFIALGIPAQVAERAQHIQTQWLPDLAAARPIRRENLHITLRFLGDVSPALVPELELALQAVAAEHRVLSLECLALGAFPRPAAAQVLVWHLEPTSELLSLYSDLQTHLAELGLQPEARPYRPHLTLFRLTSPQALSRFPKPPALSFRAPALRLCRSELAPAGVRYRCLYRAELSL